MILVAPYFEDIQELANFADELEGKVAKYLSKDDATHQNIFNEFSKNKQEIMLMSHGKYDYPMCKDHEPAILNSDLTNLVPYGIYSYSCNTAKEIGLSYGKVGGIWFGYDGRIAMPTPEGPTLEAYISIFDFIIKNFPLVKSQAAAMKFINDLKKVCESAIEMILDNDPLAIGSEEQPINNIWERLRISIESIELRHEKSSPGNHSPLMRSNTIII